MPIATTRQQGAFLQLTPLRRLADDLRTSRPADRRHPGSGAPAAPGVGGGRAPARPEGPGGRVPRVAPALGGPH